MENKRFTIGSLAVILGLILLSLQYYGLSLLQYIDMDTGSYFTDPIGYAKYENIEIAMNLTELLIIFGLVMMCYPLMIKVIKRLGKSKDDKAESIDALN